MKIIINDLSFKYPFYDRQTALDKLHDFIEMCQKIESGIFHNVDGICSTRIDTSAEMAPSCSLYKILQSFETKDQQRYLLGLLTSRPAPPPISEDLFSLDGKSSAACAHACKSMVVSLLSHAFFQNEVLSGHLGDQEIEIKNLSRKQHFKTHGKILGLRIYRANAVKHKRNRENAYGKGKTASMMDLDDAEGQVLLHRAVCIGGKLYGRKNGHDYAFQCEQGIIYHGYQVNDLSGNILSELNKYDWD